MLFLRSLVFNIAFLVWTAIVCVGISWTYFMPRKVCIRFLILYFSSCSWLEKHIIGLTYEVKGLEHRPKGSYIAAIKHESEWDTFRLFQIFGDVSIVLKRELMFIPFWGWYQWKSGAIPLDRGAGASALRKLKVNAKKVIDRGQVIAIFPQGTRVPAGAKRPYKGGVGVIYSLLDLPVVPVALNSGVFWPKQSFIKKPGVITVEFLPVIPAGLPRQEMMKLMEERIEAASDRLTQAAGGPALGSVA